MVQVQAGELAAAWRSRFPGVNLGLCIIFLLTCPRHNNQQRRCKGGSTNCSGVFGALGLKPQGNRNENHIFCSQVGDCRSGVASERYIYVRVTGRIERSVRPSSSRFFSQTDAEETEKTTDSDTFAITNANTNANNRRPESRAIDQSESLAQLT